jgi:hypothetical protein
LQNEEFHKFAFRWILFFLSMALPAHSGLRPLTQFHNHFSQPVGLLGRVISPSQGRYLNTGQHKHRINAYTHKTSMMWVGFKPTTPASERAKTVHALDRPAIVTGSLNVITLIQPRIMEWVWLEPLMRRENFIPDFGRKMWSEETNWGRWV